MRGKIYWRVSRPIVLIPSWILDIDLGIEMGPYYKSVTSASNILPLDKTLLAEMEAANEEELKKLDEHGRSREDRRRVGDFGCVESSSE